jgi:hypothetical protein
MLVDESRDRFGLDVRVLSQLLTISPAIAMPCSWRPPSSRTRAKRSMMVDLPAPATPWIAIVRSDDESAEAAACNCSSLSAPPASGGMGRRPEAT